MAFTLSADAQSVFFSKVFGPEHPVTKDVQTLLAAGVTFELSLFSVTATLPNINKPFKMNTTYGTTSLMKGSVAPEFVKQNKALIEGFVDLLMVKMKLKLKVTHIAQLPLAEAAAQATAAVQGLTAAMAKPVDAVISLKDAQALGQQVHGTTAGSVYHTVAIGAHVKVAARLMAGGAVSLRAEWVGADANELQLLEKAGMQMKAGYGSIHYDAAEVPFARIVGAFLVGTGIEWEQAVMNGSQLVITGAK